MASKGKILIADDESSLRLILSKELARLGYFVDVAKDGEEVLKQIREKNYNVVLLDIVMPKKDGISVLQTIKKESLPVEVIILTGNATVESAIECMKLGAFEYLKKPYNRDELFIQIERAMERQKSRIELELLQNDLKRNGSADLIIGKSLAMQSVMKFINRVAPTQSTVLILGDSGTGKEVVARAIHKRSHNKNKAFVAVNCATFSETLLESELFGHEKGAFTDAKTQKRGLAEMADGGTLFLDEIGEIPIHFQAKLLRFIETGEIRRVGGTKDIKLNVRLVCATNRDLERLSSGNEFRSDLYYRLNVLSIKLPTLSERTEDIPLLVEHTLSLLNVNKKFTNNAYKILKKYNWPGNIRELKNIVERVCILSNNSEIDAEDLSFLIPSSRKTENEFDVKKDENISKEDKYNYSEYSLKELERTHIINVLKHVNGQKGKAAKILGINPKTLYKKIKSYEIVSTYE